MTGSTQAKLAKAGAVCGLCAALLDLPITALFAQLQPGYNRLESYSSVLGATGSPNGRLISAWWVLYGVLLVLFCYSLLRSSSRKGWRRWPGPLLLLVFALGDGIGSGVFRCDPGCAGLAARARMHLLVSAIGSLALVPAPLFMWNAWRDDRRWRRYLPFTLAVQAVGLIPLVGLGLAETRATGLFAGTSGLFQRLFLLTYYVWIAAVAVKLLRLPALEAGPPGRTV
jgi:hypothetical protein